MEAAHVYILMKPLAEAKSRLAGVLGPRERALLSLEMARRVIEAAAGAEQAEVVVVGGDEAVSALSDRLGAVWQRDEASGLNACLRSLLARDAERRPRAFLPADLPLLTQPDVARLVKAAAAGSVVLAPDRHGCGTNALAVPAGQTFEPRFGEGSFSLHLDQAEAGGSMPCVVRSPGLLLDVDTPEDLALLLEAEPEFWRRAEALAPIAGLVGQSGAASHSSGV